MARDEDRGLGVHSRALAARLCRRAAGLSLPGSCRASEVAVEGEPGRAPGTWLGAQDYLLAVFQAGIRAPVLPFPSRAHKSLLLLPLSLPEPPKPE